MLHCIAPTWRHAKQLTDGSWFKLWYFLVGIRGSDNIRKYPLREGLYYENCSLTASSVEIEYFLWTNLETLNTCVCMRLNIHVHTWIFWTFSRCQSRCIDKSDWFSKAWIHLIGLIAMIVITKQLPWIDFGVHFVSVHTRCSSKNTITTIY